MDRQKKLLLIYNQKAGKSTFKTHLADVIDVFTKSGYDVMAHPTQSANDAEQTAYERASRCDLIVCAGGDGTLAEVASGLYRSGVDIPLGYIPSGSTNDYAASIELPKSNREAAEYIVNGIEHRFDFGKFNDRFFIYVAAFGWFTDVSYSTDQKLKNVLGHSAYLLEAGKRLFKMPEHEITIRVAGMEMHEKIVYGMITNTRSVGGLKDFAWHEVEMDDGLFEVTLVRTPTNLVELSDAVSCLLSGDPCHLIIKIKTEKVEILSEEPIKWTIDGEEADAYTHVVAENIPKALRLIVKEQ